MVIPLVPMDSCLCVLLLARPYHVCVHVGFLSYYSKNTEVIFQRIACEVPIAIQACTVFDRRMYHMSHFVCTTMDATANSTPALAPTNAAMSPDAAGGDGSSALFLALQNPSLSKAASVLLRSMKETGSISGEDAALMSAFLSSCDIPQPDDFVGEGIGGASGNNKRSRDIAQSVISDLGGDDEIRAAAAARTVTAQIPDSEWVSEARLFGASTKYRCCGAEPQHDMMNICPCRPSLLVYTYLPPHKLLPCMQLLTHAGTKSDQ